jgi:hypothetical protein
MRLGTYDFTETSDGILTVGQLIKALEGLDANTQIVIGDPDNGWYNNIDGFHTPSEDGYTALTFSQGNPVDSQQF